jgi:HEAT repeat protein
LSEPEEIILSDEETRLLATAKAFKSGKKKVSWETAAAPHQDVQRYCARLLASVVNADVTESLIAALDKEIDEETRTAALFSLAKHGEKTGALPVRSIDVFQELAKDDDTEIRALAVRCLGWIQADGINQQLQGWLKHSDAQVRVEAVRALDQRNHASDPLIDALDDPYEGVSIAAARALARLYGVDAVDALVLFSLTNDGTFRREIGQLLGRYAPDAGAARLLDVLADDDQKARWLVAIDALAELFQQDPEPEALKVA